MRGGVTPTSWPNNDQGSSVPVRGSRHLAVVLLRGLGFIGLPLILAWGFWGWFAADQTREEVAQRRQDMRDLLNRVAAVGNLRQRLEEKIGRLARVALRGR